jgi:hypothetical protein
MRSPAVLRVLRAIDDTQIRNAVIDRVAIDMIYLALRPLAMYDEPREAMRTICRPP